MSVVDGYLKVYGVDNLRIADGSIMPRVTTGNTMAPCVIIGERAAEILRTEHKLQHQWLTKAESPAVPRLAHARQFREGRRLWQNEQSREPHSMKKTTVSLKNTPHELV
jgi:hypothetical protein